MTASPNPLEPASIAAGTEPTLAATATPSEAADEAAPRRRRRGFAVWASLLWTAFIVVSAVFGGLLPLTPPNQVGVGNAGEGISPAHLLGSDALGRDELSRLIFGARISLLVGVGSIAIALPAGVLVGLVAGYLRGWVDAVVSVVLDTLLAFPALVFSLAIVAFVGPSLPIVIISLAIFGVAPTARVVRGATIRSAQPEFVLAARLLGAKSRRIIVRELLPGVLIPTLSFALIGVAFTVVVEASLSFFGVDVKPPTASWGNMINEGTGVMQQFPLLVVWPSLFLFLTVVALNYLADYLQSRFDGLEGRL